jgi:hypothetical protein
VAGTTALGGMTFSGRTGDSVVCTAVEAFNRSRYSAVRAVAEMNVRRCGRVGLVSVWLLFVWGCFGPGNLDPKDLTEQERAVKVYHQGKQPECEYDELGTVEATSGTATEMGTYDSSVAKLQREAAALGASGVIVIDHSKNQMADQATGLAIRCK